MRRAKFASKSRAATFLLLLALGLQPSDTQPSITKGTYEFVRLHIHIAGDDGNIQQVAAIGALVHIRFDRPLFLEHYNGSFHYWPLDSLVDAASLDGLTHLECIGHHEETGTPIRFFSTESLEYDPDLASSHARLFPLYWGMKSFRPNLRPQHKVDDVLNHLLVRGRSVPAHRMPEHSAKNRMTTSEYFATVLLQVEDLDGSLHQSPLLAREAWRLSDPTVLPTERSVLGIPQLRRVLAGCRLRFIGHSEQEFWPLRALVDQKAHRVSPDELTLLLPSGAPQENQDQGSEDGHKSAVPAPRPVDVILSAQGLRSMQPERVRAHHDQSSFARHYPSVQAGWHPSVPPMPSYCGLTNGSLTEAAAMDLREQYEMSFIETRIQTGGIPFLDKILDMVMKIIMPGIMDPFLDNLETHTANTLGPQTSHEVDSETPDDVIEKLAPMLRYNLTNLLPDLLTAHLTRTLTTELTMEIGPSVLHEVTESLAPALHREVAEVLSRAIPERVLGVLPYLLERSLPIALTRDLTRTLTHAMVPTLSYALSRTPAQDWYCNECYTKQKHCKECHDSPYAQYYTNYYSTYYADYFSEYYQEYYTTVLVKLDETQHPLGGSETATESKTAKEALKHNLGQEYFQKPFLWKRPMTASGTPPESHLGGPAVGDTVPAPYDDRQRMDSHLNWTHPTLKDPTKPTVQGQLWGPPTMLKPDKL